MDIHDMVGKHECIDCPPALFDQDGAFRHGANSMLINVILDEVLLEKRHALPEEQKSRAVVVDARMLRNEEW